MVLKRMRRGKTRGERDEGVDGAFQKCPIVVIATALK
jgi:hypothetical protein